MSKGSSDVDHEKGPDSKSELEARLCGLFSYDDLPEQTVSALGRHILAELHGVSSERLNDPGLLERTLIGAAQDAGATVIESSFNPFAPHGVTGIVVIQESHLSIHTWPEHLYAAVDVFTCGSSVDPWRAYESLKNAFEADRGSAMEVHRGRPDLL